MLCWLRVCGVVACAVTTAVSAKEFPLEFKTLPSKEALSFPGGYGAYAQLQKAKPDGLRKEPKAVSRHPVYGALDRRGAGSGPVFRIEESKGDMKGYDQLILDLNQNGDLTDDPVLKAVDEPGQKPPPGGGYERALFGPIHVKVSSLSADWQPIYYAELFIYNRLLPMWARESGMFTGQLRLRAGWYLEATIEVDGAKHKIGLADSDGNLRLGESPKAETYRSGNVESWHFDAGDSFLRDLNQNGKFDNDRFGSEAESFGPILYFGAAPYQVTLGANCKSVEVQPYPEPLAELSLQPQGEQVTRVSLAWERPDGKWQLVNPAVVQGKAKAPPGSYRLYGCFLRGKAKDGSERQASAYQRARKTPLKVAAGQTTDLRCGGPLEIQVTTRRDLPGSSPPGESSGDTSISLLRINAMVVGAGGETYTSYGGGKDGQGEPPKPVYTILDAKGKQIASGNLEFG
jgi:hypothetical protein